MTQERRENDRPVEEEGDKDIKEGGMAQQQEKPHPAQEERG